MRKQSAKATAGSRIMTSRLVLPLSNGRSQAPTISKSPGCTHSGVIVVFATREPQFPQELRGNDDRHTRDQAVDGPPGLNAFEPEVRVVRVDEVRDCDFTERE